MLYLYIIYNLNVFFRVNLVEFNFVVLDAVHARSARLCRTGSYGRIFGGRGEMEFLSRLANDAAQTDDVL